MLRQIDVSALYWIGMDLIELFLHHDFVKYQFGMNALLPKLIAPVLLVG